MSVGGAVTLQRHDRDVRTVFDLLGDDENDMTAALGYVLSRAPATLAALFEDLGVQVPAGASRTVRLQRVHPGGGITDVELIVPGVAYVVLEAKRGVALPTRAQLAQYAAVANGVAVPTRLLVTLSQMEATPASSMAERLGYAGTLDGVPVTHRSWRAVQQLIQRARTQESHAGRRLIDQFTAYLDEILGMQTRHSIWTYVVSLGSWTDKGWQMSMRDVVTRYQRYYYPVGKGWPEPPNYIAFRYDGVLQSIHHVDRHEVFTNPGTIFVEAPQQEWAPHYLLHLGPAIRPPVRTPTGPRIQRAARVWCHLDTLLTSPTISAALTATEERECQ